MKNYVNRYLLSFFLILFPTRTEPVLEKLLLPACVYTSFKMQNPLAWGLSTSFLSYCFVNKIQEWTILNYEKPSIKVDPSTTVFAFDFHDVLVTPDFKKGLKEVLQTPHKLMVLKDVLKPWFLIDFITLFSTTIFEDMVNSLAAKYADIKPIRHSLFAIGNAQVPIVGTFNIIKSLKELGYKIYLFSNIGEHMFREFLKEHPTLFEHFDDFFVTNKSNDYAHKPNKHAYTSFLSKFNFKPHNVVFVDNSPKNIAVGDELGIYGIRFVSVPQLQADLESLGVFKNK